MKYALLIYRAPGAGSDDELPDSVAFAEWVAYTEVLKRAGALVAASPLQDVETATTVRLRGGERLLTDGPFIETKEHLLGFYLVEVPNLDAAIDLAARIPIARYGSVEVRPVRPLPAWAQAAPT